MNGSFQLLISLRHSFTSRLLYTVLPSELYVGDKTLDQLHATLVEDLQSLYYDGLKVSGHDIIYVHYVKFARIFILL